MDQLAQWISPQYALLGIFVGSLVGGEVAVLAGVLLVLAGTVPVWTLFALVLVANLLSDTAWFLAGGRLLRFADRWRGPSARVERALAVVDRVDRRRDSRYLLWYKFVYGIRIVTIVYSAMRRVPLRRFLVLDTIGAAAYLSILIAAGLALCRNAIELAPAAQALRYGIVAALAVVVLARVGTEWLRSRLCAG